MTPKSIAIITRLKTSDAASETAFQCLTHDMEQSADLRQLQRCDFWKITFTQPDISHDELLTFGRRIALETKIFVNPNKHLFDVKTIRDSYRAKLIPEFNAVEQPIVVFDRDDLKGRQSLQSLKTLYGYESEISRIDYGVLWIMTLKTESFEKAEKIASNLAITRNLKQGLLSNPHAQFVIINGKQFPEFN